MINTEMCSSKYHTQEKFEHPVIFLFTEWVLEVVGGGFVMQIFKINVGFIYVYTSLNTCLVSSMEMIYSL